MRNILIVLVLLFIGLEAHGQIKNPCDPVVLSDTIKINRCYDSAQYFFDGHDYLKAASCFHKAEKIIPNCSEIRECLAACYWGYYQDGVTYDVKHMLLAKKYLELCQQDKSIPRENKIQYHNCLNEINGILSIKLVNRHYNDGRYYGEMNNDKRDGFGIFYYNNGQRYEGRWIDDKKVDLEGELYDAKNELIYKGVFSDDERLGFSIVNLKEELEYWGDMKNSDDKQKSINQVCDSISNSINSTIDQFITDGEKITNKGKLGRNFIDINYSLSGFFSLRTGSVYPSRWGQYSSFGVRGDMIKEGLHGINSLRYTIGALYAPTNWMYVYAGGGLSIDSLNANDHIKPTADVGLLFRLGMVSLSTGVFVDDFLSNPTVDFSFGFGLNFHKSRTSYSPFTYYVYSPMAPYGIMSAWYRNRISGYFKIQIPMYGEKIQQLIAPDYKDNPVRFSYTAGATTSLTSWLGFYAGLGMGVYKDKLDDITKRQGLDAEFGISLRASRYFSVIAGLHAVNITQKDRFLTYDIGIGMNTWKLFLKRANHTIFEYSYSETAKVGLMNGFIYNWFGYYNRIQLTNPFQKNNQHNYSDKWNGSRYSLTAGPMIALTDWLFIHGGIGMGIYRKDNSEKTTDVGFETELGVSLRAWLFDVSFGPHWCRVGKEDTFLDYNLGVGVNILTWMGGGYEDDVFFEFRYSRHAQFGFNMGMLYDVGGWYLGLQGGIEPPNFRMNLSAGVVFAPSALMHFKLGAGVGLYRNQFGFDMEAMYSLVLWRFPVTIGLKLCRIGSPNMFMEPIYGVGTIGGF